MKVNTTKKLMLAASVVIILNFCSCGKYDDGPKFSLASKTGRLSGEWEVVKVGGTSVTDNLILEFEKKGDFKYTYTDGSYSYSYSGDWEWHSKKETIKITIDGDVMEWDINRLTNKELWFEDDSNEEWKCEKK
jgi:hypothetical protein